MNSDDFEKELPMEVRMLMKIAVSVLTGLETIFDEIDKIFENDIRGERKSKAVRISFVQIVAQVLKPADTKLITNEDIEPEQIGEILKRQFGNFNLDDYKLGDDE